MKTNKVLGLLLVGFIAGCSNEKPVEKVLTCADNPKGRPKAEQMAIADACFRRGEFKKSPPMSW